MTVINTSTDSELCINNIPVWPVGWCGIAASFCFCLLVQIIGNTTIKVISEVITEERFVQCLDCGISVSPQSTKLIRLSIIIPGKYNLFHLNLQIEFDSFTH